jgi:uncharacterized protein YciW
MYKQFCPCAKEKAKTHSPCACGKNQTLSHFTAAARASTARAAARRCDAALSPCHVYEAVDAKRDEAEDNEQDNDNDGNDIVFLHDV